MEFVSKHGEIIDKDELIGQIESLLNALPNSTATHLNKNIMSELDMPTLLDIRDNLIQKQQNVLELNKQWLLNLVDSN